MKKVFLVVVGKLGDAHLEAIENEYLKRITGHALTVVECRAFGDKELEGKEVAKKVVSLSSKPHVVLLAECGKEMDSPKFASWYFECLERTSDAIFLVIGGAEGHGSAVLNLCQEKISLSLMTFPHKLARILVIEQIYRAQTIRSGHPYHK